MTTEAPNEGSEWIMTHLASALAFVLFMGGLFGLLAARTPLAATLAISAIASPVFAFLVRKTRPVVGLCAMLFVFAGCSLWIWVALDALP
jgi:hypothetical protein